MSKMHWLAFREFIKKYTSIWKEIWSVREQLDPPIRHKDEREFLPAHLELTETPVSSAPKWTARLIITFTILALLWAFFGKLDIVAVANGKTSLGGRSKTIQPLETAVVEKINVSEGQSVDKGDVLVELSGIGSETDYTRSLDALRAAYLTQKRSEVLLSAIDKKQSPKLEMNIKLEDTNKIPSQIQSLRKQIISSINQNELIEAQNLVTNQYQAWLTKDEQLSSVKEQHIAERASILAQINKLKGITAIEAQRTADYRELVSQNFLSKHNLYEQETKYIQAKNDLSSQLSSLQQVEQAIEQAIDERLLNSQTLKRDTLDILRQSKEQITQLEAEALKSYQRKEFMQLSSPVNGTVQQLSTHTVGGVVTAAQPIMVIVPNQDKLEIEAVIPNKDIGFVDAGQEAIIKVESFPYTRYGYLTGKVKSVSFDAVENKDLGLVYTAIISLDKDTLNIDGKNVRLDAGMNVTAEIKTGKRRIISYLLSPLQTKVDESLRER